MEFSFSVKISPYCSSVLSRLGAAASEDSSVSDVFSALNRQCTPSVAEETVLSCELDDPFGESVHAVTKKLIRQYKNRCLLKVTDNCFSHCRFCPYRGTEKSEDSPFITAEDLSEACAFLEGHPEINEIIIAGGDPLSASDEQLASVFEAVRKVRPGILIRLRTRAPVSAPERISRETLALFRRFRPFWIVPQIHHPAEIAARWAPEAQKCLLSIVDAGIPVQTETQLLRGVNDAVPVLAELYTLLVHLGVKPGFLYQPGLAKGTGHFRVPLAEGLKIYNKLKNELSDLSLPVYALELPGGGGLVNIPATRFAREGDTWKYTDASGKSWFYPV
ncbi:MAG: radical SAM protein [Treponema sp.]|nr:radical SAM protein [Candidatus Treponema caballi]